MMICQPEKETLFLQAFKEVPPFLKVLTKTDLSPVNGLGNTPEQFVKREQFSCKYIKPWIQNKDVTLHHKAEDVLAKLILLTFTFLFFIVMMNVLNALAIGDTEVKNLESKDRKR